MAQNEGFDVGYNFLLDSARGDSTLQQNAALVSRSTGSEFILQEMVDVVGVAIHH